MKKIYKILIIMCCISVYFMGGNYNMYAKTKSDNIDYEAVSKELETEIKKNHIPGMSVVVVNSNEVVFSKTYGIVKALIHLL